MYDIPLRNNKIYLEIKIFKFVYLWSNNKKFGYSLKLFLYLE